MSWLRRLWSWLPVWLRAIVVGELVVTLGGLPPALLLLGNLKLFPRVPWLLVPTALWLALLWWWLDGGGWPRGTRDTRRQQLNGGPVPARVWPLAVLAGACGLIASLCLGFLTVLLSRTPASAFAPEVDLRPLPWWTLVAFVLSIAATAGVVEEAGYRGYLLTPIRERHGWVVAALVSGTLFYLDHHLSHAYATIAYLPFFVVISAVHALLVRATGSIRPSVWLHAIFDAAVVPSSCRCSTVSVGRCRARRGHPRGPSAPASVRWWSSRR